MSLKRRWAHLLILTNTMSLDNVIEIKEEDHVE